MTQSVPSQLVALAALMFAVLSAGGCGRAVASAPPNFVLIIGDDHGYPDFGFMGSPDVATPRLDQLAAEGTVFPYGYSTASVCAPALRTLLTGLHPVELNAGIRQLATERNAPARVTNGWLDPTPFLHAVHTLPRLLAERGYESFQAGKYWDRHYAISGFTDGMTAGDDGMLNGIRIARETMQPAFDFIDAHLETPFLLWFAPMLPHLPFDAPEAFMAPYAEADVPLDVRGYYANISRFDAAVGQLIAHLRERNLSERTIVVFTADNGWQAGARPGTSKGKNTLYELGFRTPIVLYGPGRIPSGEIRGDLVSIEDLFPTLLDYAGVEPVPGRPGRSLMPHLASDSGWARDRIIGAMEPMNPNNPGWIAARAPSNVAWFRRDARWHYIRRSDGSSELYDTLKDPDEETDVGAQHAALTKQYSVEIDAWYRDASRYRIRDTARRSP